jgi:hypothetical protein
MQKRASGGADAPQAGHARSSCAPQLMQKLASGGFADSQFAQISKLDMTRWERWFLARCPGS